MDKQEIVRILLSIIDEIVLESKEMILEYLVLGNKNYKSKNCDLYNKFIDTLMDVL